MIYRTKIFAIILLLTASSIHAQEKAHTKTVSLSLERAMEMALENSSGIKAARLEADISKAKLKQATAYMMPKLTFSETFLRSNDQVAVFGSKLRQGAFTPADFDINALNNPDSLNNMESKLSFNLPLFTSGMNYFMRKAAKYQLKAQEKMTGFEESRLKMNVAKLYYGILSAQEALSHIEEGILQMNRLAKSYKLMGAPNSATTTSYLLSEVTKASLEQKREMVKTQKSTMIKTLSSILEIEPDTKITLSDRIPEEFRHEQKDDLKRQDLLALSLNIDALSFKKRSLYSTLGPRVDFFTSYAYNHSTFGSGEGAYQLGFVLTFNLFEYSRYGKIDEIKARSRQLDLLFKENAKNNETAIAKALTTFNGKKNELKFAKTAFGKADDALSFANLRYSEGSLPLKDLSQAIAHWVEAKVNVARARYDLVSSDIDIRFERGEI